MSDENKPPQWALDVIAGDVAGLVEMQAEIDRAHREMVSALGIDFAFVSEPSSAGSHMLAHLRRRNN